MHDIGGEMSEESFWRVAGRWRYPAITVEEAYEKCGALDAKVRELGFTGTVKITEREGAPRTYSVNGFRCDRLQDMGRLEGSEMGDFLSGMDSMLTTLHYGMDDDQMGQVLDIFERNIIDEVIHSDWLPEQFLSYDHEGYYALQYRELRMKEKATREYWIERAEYMGTPKDVEWIRNAPAIYSMPCPYDTDNDNNCGQAMCPFCGELNGNSEEG